MRVCILREPAAHPRPRGEHAAGGLFAGVGIGSSPPTRGTPSQPSLLIPPPRLIPAHAGNTRAATYPMPTASAHPRPRGEHLPAIGPKATYCGSSPPTRGTHWLTRHDTQPKTKKYSVSSGRSVSSSPVQKIKNTEIQISIFLYVAPAYPGGCIYPKARGSPDKIRGYFCAYGKCFYVMFIMWITLSRVVRVPALAGTCTRVSWYVYPR